MQRKLNNFGVWQPREHNQKAECISNMTKKLEGLEKEQKVKIHMDYGKKNSTSSIEMNKCLQETGDKKDHTDPNRPPQRNRPNN